MELDELKDVWNKVPADSQKEFTKEDIQVKSKDHSKNMMVKVRKRFLIENGISVITILPSLILLRYINNPVLIKSSIILIVASIIYFSIRLFQIQKVIGYSESLLKFLKKSIRLIKSYMRVTKLAVVIVNPIFMTFTFYLGFMDGAKLNSIWEAIRECPTWIPIVLSILVTAPSYAFVYLLYRWLYGIPIKYLKEELKKLETNTN